MCNLFTTVRVKFILVTFEVGITSKLLITLLKFVRLLSSMGPHVLFQITRLSETFPTLFTCVGPFSSVGPHVLG